MTSPSLTLASLKGLQSVYARGNFTDRCSKGKVVERLGVSRALHSGCEFGRSCSLQPLKYCLLNVVLVLAVY